MQKEAWKITIGLLTLIIVIFTTIYNYTIIHFIAGILTIFFLLGTYYSNIKNTTYNVGFRIFSLILDLLLVTLGLILYAALIVLSSTGKIDDIIVGTLAFLIGIIYVIIIIFWTISYD